MERQLYCPEDLASCHQNLATVHLNLGDFANAEEHAGLAVDAWLATVGEGDQNTLDTRLLLGAILLARGEAEGAEAELTKALEGGRLHFPESWQTFNASSLKGASLLAQKRYLEAERYLVD